MCNTFPDVQQRVRWTATAKAALNTAFKDQIDNGVLPSGLMIQHAIRHYSPLRGRTVACVKSAVSNMLLRDRRLQQYKNRDQPKPKPRRRKKIKNDTSSSDSEDC